MLPLPPFPIEVSVVQHNPIVTVLDMADDVSIATCLEPNAGWILHDLDGCAWSPTGKTSQLEAYLKAHYFPTSGFWASPAAIRFFQCETPAELEQLRKAGLTQIAKRTVVSLAHVIALYPANGDMILRARHGFLPSSPTVEPDFLPQLIAAAQDAGFTARPDGALVNPAHQNELGWEFIEDPLPDVYVNAALTSQQPNLSFNLATQALLISREPEYLTLEDLHGNSLRVTPPCIPIVEAYARAHYVLVDSTWINPAAISCVAFTTDACRLLSLEGQTRSLQTIAPRGLSLDRFVKAGLLQTSASVAFNLNGALSYREDTGELVLCDRMGNPSGDVIVVDTEWRDYPVFAARFHGWDPQQTPGLWGNRRFSKTRPKPSAPFEFLFTKAEMKTDSLFPGLIATGLASGAFPPRFAPGQED